MDKAPPQTILLTGASGYVGGRLMKALEERGGPLRCLARRPEYLRPRVAPSTEVVEGDVLNEESLQTALDGVHTAYYMVHAMGSKQAFVDQERQGAENFARCARQAGVRRIVYLGGLCREGDLSAHLRSRFEVGRILRQSGVQTLEFRASIVIGSGSLSFELVRALVEKLPVMVTPRWVGAQAQPIGIEDLVRYLEAALDIEVEDSQVIEVGGPDRVSYLDLMRLYARQRGLRRAILPVPLLTPRLSSLWLGLITPVYARVGRKLIDSLRHDTVVEDDSAARLFADIRPMGVETAIGRALHNEDSDYAQTRWSDAFSSQGDQPSWGGVRFGRRLVDSRSLELDCTAAAAFAPIRRLGGEAGYYAFDGLWRLRGAIDLVVGGAGFRRGRRDPERLLPGDTVDFWRVEACEENHLLRLAAQMRMPGRAWLQFEIEPGDSGVRVRQTAVFDPVGLLGLCYWYALYPLHHFIFSGMLRGIGRRALKEERTVQPEAQPA